MKTVQHKPIEKVASKVWVNGFLRRRFWSISIALLVGSLLSYLAVFKVFAQPRQFKGDFYAAMYNPLWWDGTGLFYGPLFVFERWLVNAFPKIFTVTFFQSISS
jgi:hypothetical protein